MSIDIYTQVLPSGFSFDMIRVEGGSFLMGEDNSEAYIDEKPVHEAFVRTFYLGEFPVTQALWNAVMGEKQNPSNFKGDRQPVEMVSWDEARVFISNLNDLIQESLNKHGFGPYRLPTEAEWEFAALGGTHSEGYLYAGSDKLREVGWYGENSDNQTHDVGLLMANELGLYDMSGNIYEWVADHWHEDYQDAPTNGSAWLSTDKNARRVMRGGGCFDDTRHCRVSYRHHDASGYRGVNLGFRLALSVYS